MLTMNDDLKRTLEALREPVWGEPVRVVNDRLRTAALMIENMIENHERLQREVDDLAMRLADAEKERDEAQKYTPPVTPGTQIFSVVYNEDNDRCVVKENKVAEIWYNCNGWFFTEEGHSGPGFKPKHIGQVIFLDREAAQCKCNNINGSRMTDEERSEKE